MGADVCVNYKSDSFKEELIKETDGYVDVYFGTVPGPCGLTFDTGVADSFPRQRRRRDSGPHVDEDG